MSRNVRAELIPGKRMSQGSAVEREEGKGNVTRQWLIINKYQGHYDLVTGDHSSHLIPAIGRGFRCRSLASYFFYDKSKGVSKPCAQK